MISHVAHCSHRKRAAEARVILAGYSKPHIRNINTRLVGIVAVGLGLLYGLLNVVVDKLDQLVSHILFVILYAYTLLTQASYLISALGALSVGLIEVAVEYQ